MLTFLLLIRLSHLRPATVLQRKKESLLVYMYVFYIVMFVGLDKLMEPLRTTVQSQVKANSVKQEFEKQEEMKRSAIKCVVALLAIPDAGKYLSLSLSLSLTGSTLIFYLEKNSQLMEFLQQIKSNADTAALYESVQLDSTLASTPTSGEPMDLS